MNLRAMEADIAGLKRGVAGVRGMTIAGMERHESGGKVAFGRGTVPRETTGAIKQFWITDPDFPDTVLCAEYEGGHGVTHVAKPWLLRKSAQHLKTRDGWLQTFTGNVTLDASKSGMTTEHWVINPRLLVGDVIHAVNRIYGRDVELKGRDDKPVYTDWVIPDGSRAWAKKA